MIDNNNAEQSQPVETQPELVNPTPAEDPVTTHERAMFNKYVKDQGQKIPSNFKDADAWFNSLMEARKGFTQARQEVAALKKQYNENGVNNPGYQQPSVESQIQEEPKQEDLSGVPEDLKIATQDLTNIPVNSQISSEYWAKWGK